MNASSLRVFCFPFAGGTGLAYKSWFDLDPCLDFVPLDYPGRLLREGEPALASVQALADQLFDEIRHELTRPFALLGTSLGALVALEVCARCERESAAPVLLVLCSCAAPSRLPKSRSIGSLPDEAFVAQLAKLYGGAAETLLGDPELARTLVPHMRADVCAFEGYAGAAAPRVATGILAVRGVSDRAVTFADVARWSDYSGADATSLVVPGDHFFTERTHAGIHSALRDKLGSL